MASDYPFDIFKLFLYFVDMTADITVLQQNYNCKLKELFRATEDDCGGASVDDRFYKMLEEIVGRNVIAELKENCTVDWLDLLRKVSIKKKIYAVVYEHNYIYYSIFSDEHIRRFAWQGFKICN